MGGGSFALVDSTILIQSPQHIVSGMLHADGSIAFSDTLLMRQSRGTVTRQSALKGSDASVVYLTVEGIRTMSVSDHRHVSPRGLLKTREICSGVDGLENIAYAVTTDQLHVMDFDDPNSPDTLASLPFFTHYVKVRDTDRIFTYDSILTLFDVSDKRALKIRSRIGLGRNIYGVNLAFHDSIIAVACAEQGLFILTMRDDSLIITSHRTIKATDIMWREDSLLVTALDTLLTIWDLSSPANPSLIISIPVIVSEGRPFARNDGGYAITASGDSLLIGGTWSTLLLNLYSLSVLNEFRQSKRLKLSHGLLFSYDYGLSVYRLGAQYEQTEVGGTSANRDGSFSLEGELVYVAAGNQGLKVLKIDMAKLSTPLVPNRASSPIIRSWPNPVLSHTNFTYNLPSQAWTTLSITDLLGWPVLTLVDVIHGPGEYSIRFDRSGLPNGIYYYHLTHGHHRHSGKLVIVN